MDSWGSQLQPDSLGSQYLLIYPWDWDPEVFGVDPETYQRYRCEGGWPPKETNFGGGAPNIKLG